MNKLRRGAYERPGVPGSRVYDFVTSKGTVAFSVTVNASAYPVEQLARVLRVLERQLLDPIDPPLRLVASQPAPQRVSLPPAEDPYRSGPRGLV